MFKVLYRKNRKVIPCEERIFQTEKIAARLRNGLNIFSPEWREVQRALRSKWHTIILFTTQHSEQWNCHIGKLLHVFFVYLSTNCNLHNIPICNLCYCTTIMFCNTTYRIEREIFEHYRKALKKIWKWWKTWFFFFLKKKKIFSVRRKPLEK